MLEGFAVVSQLLMPAVDVVKAWRGFRCLKFRRQRECVDGFDPDK